MRKKCEQVLSGENNDILNDNIKIEKYIVDHNAYDVDLIFSET